MIYTDGIHIVADSLEELHNWAIEQGIKRHWFEGSKKGHPHYDAPAFFRRKMWKSPDFCGMQFVSKRYLLERSQKMKY